MSQHIGDIDSLETYQFLKDSVKQMQNLVNTKPDVIACDLHPSMHTTRLARVMAESGKRQVQVQHHYAHAASLMVEHDLDMITIVCDGAGYGLDGAVWGGEVIVCDKSGFDRAASLAKQPMIGGDLATYFPLRMAAGILNGKVEGLDEYLYSKSDLFPNGRKEVEFILNTKQAEMTSSTGRILDAVSAVLGICYERTYEGEPAMKLESAAMGGTDLGIKPRIDRNTLDTTFLLQHIYENKDRHSTRDLAYFAHSYIAGGFAEMACNQSKVTGIKTVGFSGGVAYNDLFLHIIKNKVESLGLRFIQHEKVPPGDAGISVGQAYMACNML
jgi:hydrogenase maturation protein HypF